MTSPFFSSSPPPHAPNFLTEVDQTDALQQLATLDVFDKAVTDARAQGGPTPALAALMERPLKVGGYVLKSICAYHFLFLNLIKSPFLAGGQVAKEELPLHVARALLAFASVPSVSGAADESPCYLSFGESGPVVDMRALTSDAWALSFQLSLDDISRATEWLLGRLGGIAAMFPADEGTAGEEAENFQTAEPPVAP